MPWGCFVTCAPMPHTLRLVSANNAIRCHRTQYQTVSTKLIKRTYCDHGRGKCRLVELAPLTASVMNRPRTDQTMMPLSLRCDRCVQQASQKQWFDRGQSWALTWPELDHLARTKSMPMAMVDLARAHLPIGSKLITPNTDGDSHTVLVYGTF